MLACSSITDLYSSLQSRIWVLHPEQNHRILWRGAATWRHRYHEAAVFRRHRGRRRYTSGIVAGGRPLRLHLRLLVLIHHQVFTHFYCRLPKSSAWSFLVLSSSRMGVSQRGLPHQTKKTLCRDGKVKGGLYFI